MDPKKAIVFQVEKSDIFLSTLSIWLLTRFLFTCVFFNCEVPGKWTSSSPLSGLYMPLEPCLLILWKSSTGGVLLSKEKQRKTLFFDEMSIIIWSYYCICDKIHHSRWWWPAWNHRLGLQHVQTLKTISDVPQWLCSSLHIIKGWPIPSQKWNQVEIKVNISHNQQDTATCMNCTVRNKHIVLHKVRILQL